ncbi:MAG: hypothetical protein IJB34_04895 [Clostridia bacterium]|nr:hypothetical protein [Clostridia bacterium]
MEILILVLLYYLSQNPAFSESVKPLMSKLKDSEQMLQFLNDLSRFTQTLGAFQGKSETSPPPEDQGEKKDSGGDKETPRSPTEGIADAFIQQILDGYLKKR